MNISWYKNYYYLFALIFILLILLVAYQSTKVLPITVSSPDGSFVFSTEIIFRVLFNPIWAVVLFFFEKARKLNAELHEKILRNLEGVIFAAQKNGDKKILTSTLASFLVDSSNVEGKIKEALDGGINMKDGGTDPVI